MSVYDLTDTGYDKSRNALRFIYHFQKYPEMKKL
jgi:hypothetical protein